MNNPMLNTLANLVLGFGVPLVLFWIGSHIKDANTRDAYNSAVARAAGVAYDAMVRNVASPPGAARASALNAAVGYLHETMPETLRHLGVDEGKLRNVITGELGKLLASDPSVSIAQPVAVLPPEHPESAGLTAAAQMSRVEDAPSAR